jgi:DNA repair protein RadC
MYNRQQALEFELEQVAGGISLCRRIRIQLIPDDATFTPVTIRSAEDVFSLFGEEAARWDRERFVSVPLDSKNRTIGYEEVSVGTIAASLVHPREVFKGLLLANAASFIVVHNHPSGDPTPSEEDRRITKRLRDGAEVLGLTCLDHIILGRDSYQAMSEHGWV